MHGTVITSRLNSDLAAGTKTDYGAKEKSALQYRVRANGRSRAFCSEASFRQDIPLLPFHPLHEKKKRCITTY